MKQLAIFDFDGTLGDTMPWFTANLNQAAGRYGFRQIDAAEGEQLRGLGAREIMARLELARWKVPLVAIDLRTRMRRSEAPQPLFAGVDALLHELAAVGMALAIVSSNSQATIERALGDAAALIGRYECGTALFGKARRLRRLLRAFELPASTAVYIGDELRDIDAARAVGMPSISVGWGYNTPQALRSHTPDALVDTVAALRERLIPQSL